MQFDSEEKEKNSQKMKFWLFDSSQLILQISLLLPQIFIAEIYKNSYSKAQDWFIVDVLGTEMRYSSDYLRFNHLRVSFVHAWVALRT